MTTKAALSRSIKPEWRDVVIVRTARVAHRCVGAEEHRYFTVTSAYARPVGGCLSVGSIWPDLASAEAHAAWAREARPEAEVSIESTRNPNYRPDCLGDIAAGDLYGDYIGEAGFAESGKPYCSSCMEVWK